jgi:peptidylprolyl isomerase
MNMNSITAGMLVALAASTALTSAIAQTQPQTRPAQQVNRPASPATSATSNRTAAPPTSSQSASSTDDRPAETTAKGGEIIARIGTSDVTAEEVRAAVAFLDPRQQAALARDPALLSQTLRSLLASRLVLKEALAKKWDQQPAIVAQLARARENLIVESYLQSVTTPPENYPGDADVKAVYDANASAFLVPRRFQLAQIVVIVPKNADKTAEDTARGKLDEVLKKVRQPGADFAVLARNLSDDTSTAERDGEIGWVAEPDLRPEIRSQIVGLAKAGVADPVRLDDGWHVIKLMDTEASRVRPLAEVRDLLVQRIRTERTEANRRAYVADLLKQTPPVINELALSKLLDAKSAATPSR